MEPGQLAPLTPNHRDKITDSLYMSELEILEEEGYGSDHPIFEEYLSSLSALNDEDLITELMSKLNLNSAEADQWIRDA